MPPATTSLSEFVTTLPKVELHVHLEGSVQPETLLRLAKRHHVPLPAEDVEGLRRWYQFRDFRHFIEIYLTISRCLRTAEDLEEVTREFLVSQAEQHILHTEVTYTPYTQFQQNGLSFADQWSALSRAREWGERELGVSLNYVFDMVRSQPVSDGRQTAEWAVSVKEEGVVALGLGGMEAWYPPEPFTEVFRWAAERGLPAVPHAGETAGPESIWGALRESRAVRIGHGVRCLEDPALVEELRKRQIPLEVCPSSNVCLKVFPSLKAHPFRRLLDVGLYVTLNSDDPPLFNTTLTDEFRLAGELFGLNQAELHELSRRAARVALLDERSKQTLLERIG